MKSYQLPSSSSRSFKSFAKSENIEDLYQDDVLQNIYWNERTLFKAKPKTTNKVKKMKS